jgi:hypothetical protein
MPQIQKGKLANEVINFQSARGHCEDNAESFVCSLRYLVFVFLTV